MKIIYLGADVPSNRTILEEAGILEVGVSYWRLVKRGLPKNKDYLFSTYFDNSMRIHLHAGVPKGLQLSSVELEQFAADYETFVANNIDRIDSFTEFDHPLLTTDFVEQQRKTCWSQVPEGKFWVVWNDSTGTDGLRKLADNYLNVAITGEDIENHHYLAALTKSISFNQETRFHALACAKPDNLRQVTLETASTMSWLSPMMNGETIVWDGTKLVRYPKRMKEQARSRYRHVYEKAGLDFDKIITDDLKEISKLALWSYQQLEFRLNMIHNKPDDSSYNDNSEEIVFGSNVEMYPPDSDNKGTPMRKLERRNPAEMTNLPVFGYEFKTVIEQDEDGNDVIKDVPVVKSNQGSLRMCDTCFVAANCPAFKPQNQCAFNLPVEVKTKDQLKALINAIVEMQGQRVAFARFSEEINGGYPDPNVSQEIDRLFKLLKTVKELDDSSSFIKLSVEGRAAGAGVLSSIFGDKAQALREMPNGGFDANTTNQIIKGAIEE
jgi:hypothetical protein